MYHSQYTYYNGQGIALDDLQNGKTQCFISVNGSNREDEQSLVPDDITNLHNDKASIMPQKKKGTKVKYATSAIPTANDNDEHNIFTDSDSDSIKTGEDGGLRRRIKPTRAKVWKKKDGKEQPKILLPRNRVRAFGHFLLLHAIPLGTALALIIINIKTRYFGVDAKWVGALQYVAKVHELLMQISLVSVLVALLQYLLVHQKFVPFGAVFSAYQVSSLSYLWSSEFYAALTTSGFGGWVFAAFAVIVPFTILLAAAVGPSSAVAMQPRQVNFTLPNFQVSINASSEDLFPASFESAGPPLELDNAGFNEQSPAAGWQYLSNLPSVGADPGVKATPYNSMDLGAVGSQGTSVGLQITDEAVLMMPVIYSTPMTTTGFGGIGKNNVVRTMYVQYAPNSTFATTQSVPVALALGSVIDRGFSLTDAILLPAIAQLEQMQPFASVYCQPNPIFGENDTRPFQFPTTYVADCPSHDTPNCPPYNNVSTTDYPGSTRGQIFSQWQASPKGQIIWIHNITVSSPPMSVLGAIVIQPETCQNQNQYLMTSACVIGAQWANTTSFLRNPTDSAPTPLTHTGLYLGTATGILTPDDLAMKPNWSRPSIPLSVPWATSLDQMTDVQNRTVSDNLLRLLPITDNICPPNGSYSSPNAPSSQRPYMHERVLATMIANGMAHAASPGHLCFLTATSDPRWECPNVLGSDGEPLPGPPGIVLTMHCNVPGLAWNLNGVPIKVALVILILYCVYIGTYVIYTFVSGRSSMTWRNLSDLTALAANSMPSGVLKNTSCGIAEVGTFRNLVGLREGEGREKGLVLVFNGDRDGDGDGDGTGSANTRAAVVGRAY